MEGLVAPLLGWLLGAVLLAIAVATATAALWGAALLLGHGGALLWAWAFWLQQPETERH